MDTDAISVLRCDVIEKILGKSNLRKIEDDLDMDEKVSILFLIAENYTIAFDEIFKLLNKPEKQRAYVLLEYIKNHPHNWKNRLLEAICILPNRQVIKKLGLCFTKLELLYVPKNRLCVRNLNPVAKCLYMLCEALSEEQIKLLIDCVKADSVKYDVNFDDLNYLELHMLYWMKNNYISVHSDGRVSLKNLLKHLKQFDELELIYMDLKKYENQQNVLDNQHSIITNVPSSQAFSFGEVSHSETYCKQEDVREIKTGLCIIISQMFFSGEKYDTRFGTTADCIKLSQTFKGFGFNVVVQENLKKQAMLEKLENIVKDHGTEYDCIFVCILSHGCKGSIITADEEEVTIETLEHKICCSELKDVIKVVIIQACQGKTTGQKSQLTTDGPRACDVSEITRFRNFCIFMSTMQGFVSVRHKAQGSWFIQELCSTLQSEGSKIPFSQVVRRTIQLVENKSGKLDGVDCVAQLPELRSCRLSTDFQLPEYRYFS